MVNFSSPLRAFDKVIASLGGLLALLTWIFPDLRSWFSNHGLLGWLTVIVLITVGPILLSSLIRLQTINLLKLNKDYNLIVERLDDWTIDGDFYDYLCNQVVHTRLPTKISDDIEKHCRNWNIDSRKIKDKNLNTAFENTMIATNDYDIAINDFMFTWEHGTSPNNQIDHDYLMLSPELKRDNPAEFYKIDSMLHEKRFALVSALMQLFAALHEVSPER